MTSHRIAVLGDLIVDHDILVRPTKIAQEAPVMVVDVLDEQFRNGGAAVVNDMIRALGVESQLALNKIMTGLPVSIKRRLVTVSDSRPSQMLMRFDSNAQFEWPAGMDESLCHWLREYAPQVVVVSDYGKGVVCDGLVQMVRDAVGKSTMILVDPYTSDWSKYAGGDIILPSRSAAENFLLDGDPRGFLAVLVKLDREGLQVHGCGPVESYPSQARTVVDPCGAGDQLVATLATGLKTGNHLKHAAWTANLAAGMQCERQGIVPVASEELKTRIAQYDQIALAAAE